MPYHYAAAVTVRIGAGSEYGHSGRDMRFTAAELGAAEEETAVPMGPAMEVRSMTPRSGPVHGGSRLMVVGVELAMARALDFGGTLVSVEVVSSVLAMVETPAATVLGPVPVLAEGATYAYTEAVTVHSLSTAAVTSEGGALVTVTASLGVGQAAVVCFIGSTGPLTAIAVSGVDFQCLSPAKRPGVAEFFAGVRDDAWRSASPAPLALTIVQPPLVHAMMPPAVLAGVPATSDVFGLWLSSAACSRNDEGGLAAVAAGGAELGGAVAAGIGMRCAAAAFPGAAAFVAVRVMAAGAGDTAVAPTPLVRVAAPRVLGVLPRGGGGDGGAVIHVVGVGLASEDASAAHSPLRCVFGGGGGGRAGSGSGSSAAPAAYAVSSALARCEVPVLVGGTVNLGPGGGDVPLSVAVGSAVAVAPQGVLWAAAPTPWVRSSSPPAGGSTGGTVVLLAAGGAVEGIRSVETRAGNVQSGGVGGGGGGVAVACSLGTIGPVATRAAPAAADGVSGDLQCPTPAHAHSRFVTVRIFAHASTSTPASTRAPSSDLGNGYPTSATTIPTGPRFWYALEGYAAAMDGGAAGVGPGLAAAGSLGVGGGAEAMVRVLGWGLLPPRGVAPACIIGGEARPAVLGGATRDGYFACGVPPGPAVGRCRLTLSNPR
jgi:hypothetical protein